MLNYHITIIHVIISMSISVLTLISQGEGLRGAEDRGDASAADKWGLTLMGPLQR